MHELSFFARPEFWWPYLFILLAGWLPTDIWRYLGVLSSGRMSDNSPVLSLVRAIATALVAAVIARLVLYPTGSLVGIPTIVRVGAMVGGFAVYIVFGRKIIAGILFSQILLFVF